MREDKRLHPPGPYALTPAGYSYKYAGERMEMSQSYNHGRERRETVNVPTMALSLTEAGGAASYSPDEIEGPPDDEVAKWDAMGRSEADQEEEEKRWVDKAAYFRRYRRVRILGSKWEKAEYEWAIGRLTDYNIGRTSGCAERRGSFSRTPGDPVDEARLYLGETWIYGGDRRSHMGAGRPVGYEIESAIHAMGTGGRPLGIPH